MIAEIIRLSRKLPEKLVKYDNDVEELTKKFTNLKVTKKARSPFVTWFEEELKKIRNKIRISRYN